MASCIIWVDIIYEETIFRFCIVPVHLDAGQQVSFSFKVTNNDRFNYYILSPEKMGTGLFHYYTNGLYLYSQETGYLQNRISHESPEPWDSWDISWLELLESDSSINYHITYKHYDPVPPGTYRATFRFPGLSHVEAIEEPRSKLRGIFDPEKIPKVFAYPAASYGECAHGIQLHRINGRIWLGHIFAGYDINITELGG